jgi:hypothetical protein
MEQQLPLFARELALPTSRHQESLNPAGVPAT